MSLTVGVSGAAAQTTLTVTHSSPADSHFGVAAIAFKDVIEKETDGEINVVIQRVDNEREAIESTQLGAQECAMGSAGPLGNFIPETRVLDVPFLFDSYAQGRGLARKWLPQPDHGRENCQRARGYARHENPHDGERGPYEGLAGGGRFADADGFL
jgi:TRAP-type C4-dicarboxylate transport system substrate-binding protein